MKIFKIFFPLLLFVSIYLLSSLFFSLKGIENAFYQISPIVAILPSLILAWLINKGSSEQKFNKIINGARDFNIITMCFIFLLSGAFGNVSNKIGCVDSTVNLFLSLFPIKFISIGLFLTSALVATSIGSSMGTIATLGPLAVGLATKSIFSKELGIGIVVGGAMFGDNLSLISDTTIAAINSLKSNPKKKLKINLKYSLISSIITIFILSSIVVNKDNNINYDYSIILILPYLFLIILTLVGINVFIVLILSLFCTGFIGIIFFDYNILKFCKDIKKGFDCNYDIMTLSLLIGALNGLNRKNYDLLIEILIKILPKKSTRKVIEIIICKLVIIFDILLANNTIAILICADLTKNLIKKYNICQHKIAALLDTYSCVFQGILPYGAQILLAASLAKVSPLMIIGKVYYCYILGIVTTLFLIFGKDKSRPLDK